jgi:hypothetical protein
MSNQSALLRAQSPIVFMLGARVQLKGWHRVRQFVGDKFDVTDEAATAVAHYLVHTDDIKVFTLPDGRNSSSC